jgi:SET domain-containing protein
MNFKKLSASYKIFVGESKISGAGRGVFAKRDIKKGEVIERAPYIEVPKHDTSKLNKSIFVEYFFYFGKNKDRIALALGFGSIYNHSAKPNAKFEIKVKEMIIEFAALADIKKDQEITLNYYGSAKRKNPLWFEG